MIQNLHKFLHRTALLTTVLLIFSQTIFAQEGPYGVALSGLEWGTTSVPTAAEINYYAGKGLKLIRLPFLWDRIQPTLGQPLNTTYLTYLDNIVSAANSAGVSILLDMHNYARYPTSGGTTGPVINTSGGPTIAQYGYVWKLIAAHFANQDAVWGYDIMNEPHDLGTGNYWFPIAQAAIDSIRKVDTNHTIVIEGDSWSGGSQWVSNNDIPNNKLSNLVDPQKNLVFEAHQYFDKDHSGTYASTSFSTNNATVSTGVDLITPFVGWLKKYNLRGMVGEYGIPGVAAAADLSNWEALLDNFLAYLQSNCVLGTYWAGGPGWTWKTGQMVVEPANGTDAPQMAILQKYTSLSSSCPALVTATESPASGDLTSCFPNPFEDNLHLIIPGPFTYTLTNTTGELVIKGTGNNTADIETGVIAQGLYLLQVTQDSQSKVFKVNKK